MKFEHHCLESMLFQSVLKTPEKQLKNDNKEIPIPAISE